MRGTFLGFAATLGMAASAPSSAAEAACVMTPSERSWVNGALDAWRLVSTKRLRLEPHRTPTIVIFDAKCRFELSSGAEEWIAEPHSGSILIPDGNQIPAQVTSFAGKDETSQTPFFVMALPSIWAAAKIPISGDLEGLTAVFLHEFSHTRQIDPLKSVFTAAEAVRKMPEDFSDDSLQKHFQSDPAYVAVMEKEMRLLFQAAAEPDNAAARKLAREALALIDARQKRWFAGDDAYWRNYDDLFLTMEGFGQWVAYAWLADPLGAGLGPDAYEKMSGTRWWSQVEGLALFLVIDRFVPNWPRRAFAEKPALGIDLLRVAVAEQPAVK